jgi:rRNA maturation RNase YbeY
MVTIDSNGYSTPLNEKELTEFYKHIATKEGFLLDQVTIVLGDDDWLLDFNIRFLNHDYYTDIITFDYVESNVISGDLLVSVDRVEDNADRINVSRETEMNRVLIHGFLHLCGYNDKTPAEVELMRKKEDYYLKLL